MVENIKNNNILAYLIWLKKILFILLNQNPIQITLIYIFIIFEEIMAVIAFLLPLKILVLFNLNSVPAYFPDFFIQEGIKSTIIILSILSLFAYLLQLLLKNRIQILLKRGANILLNKSNKIISFNHYEDFIKLIFKNIIESMADLTLIFLCLFIISNIYYDIFVVEALYILLAVIIISLLLKYNKNIIISYIYNDINRFMDIVNAVAFLLAFIFMVYHFTQEKFPSVIIALITLMLIRIFTNHLKSLLSKFIRLHMDQSRVNLILFSNIKHDNDFYSTNKLFWSILEEKDIIVKKLLKDLDPNIKSIKSFIWNEIGLSDVIVLQADCSLNDSIESKSYILKIYDRHRELYALNELSIYKLMEDSVAFSNITLKLTNSFSIEKRYFNLFDIQFDYNKLTENEFSDFAYDIKIALMLVKPSGKLLDEYIRTHFLIWERIDVKMIQRLIAIEKDINSVNDLIYLRENLDFLKRLISKIPLQIVNHTILPESIIINKEINSYVFLNWANWTIEPFGSSWPTNEVSVNYLKKHFEELKNLRTDLKEILFEEIFLVTLLSEFEHRYRLQKFLKANEMVPAILKELKLLKKRKK